VYRDIWLLVILQSCLANLINLFQTSSDDGEIKRSSLSDRQAHIVTLFDLKWSTLLTKVMFTVLCGLSVLVEPLVIVKRVI